MTDSMIILIIVSSLLTLGGLISVFMKPVSRERIMTIQSLESNMFAASCSNGNRLSRLTENILNRSGDNVLTRSYVE